MKIGLTSDIHVDINEKFHIEELIKEESENLKPDVLIIGGDISDDYKKTLETVDYLNENLKIPVYFISGNHDLWNKDKKYPSTEYIYKKMTEHPMCIMDREIILENGWVILGDIMWYDYTMADIDHYNLNDIKTKVHNGRTWQDSIFTDWKKSDEKVSRYFIDKMRKRIRKYPGRKIIAVTHMITHPHYLPLNYREDIGFFYAFFGSKDIGKMLMEENVVVNHMGHIHYRRCHKEENTLFICSCLNYFSQWEKGPEKAKEEVKEAIKIIEI